VLGANIINRSGTAVPFANVVELDVLELERSRLVGLAIWPLPAEVPVELVDHGESIGVVCPGVLAGVSIVGLMVPPCDDAVVPKARGREVGLSTTGPLACVMAAWLVDVLGPPLRWCGWSL